VALYGFEHPVARETLEEVFKEITELLAGRAFLRLFIHDDTFYLGKTVLLEESLRLPHLLLDLKDREIGAIEMHEGLESWELHRLIEVLNMRPSEIHRVGGPKAFLDEKGVRHVVVGAARALAPEEQEVLPGIPGSGARCEKGHAGGQLPDRRHDPRQVGAAGSGHPPELR
jgi:hypothetical protein